MYEDRMIEADYENFEGKIAQRTLAGQTHLTYRQLKEILYPRVKKK